MAVKLRQFRYLNKLYTSNNITNIDKVKWKLSHHAGMVGLFVIVLSDRDDEELVIYDSSEFLKPHMKGRTFDVVGISMGYLAAETLVAKIAREVYDQSEDCNIKEYFLPHFESEGME